MSCMFHRGSVEWRNVDMNQVLTLTSDFICAVHSQLPVNGLTHDFYRYPARFSPQFAGAAIREFTKPGDVVLDPFMGGGTTLVEAIAENRIGAGSDINELATFVAQVKTRTLNDSERAETIAWAKEASKLNLSLLTKFKPSWRGNTYLRNLNCRASWPIRDSVGMVVEHLESLRSPVAQDFCRCVILRTAQWAIDGRRRFPSALEFRKRLLKVCTEMLDRLVDLSKELGSDSCALALNTRAEDLYENEAIRSLPAPRLVLTSPPYAGVHVLYHRWQLKGGLETPAPFWIANCNDGHGESHYTFGHRRSHSKGSYFERLAEAFRSISKVAGPETLFVQLVGFAEPKRHLPRYLSSLENVGLIEVLPRWTGQRTKRLWRIVPNRRWYNRNRSGLASEREVVLFHRLGS